MLSDAAKFDALHAPYPEEVVPKVMPWLKPGEKVPPKNPAVRPAGLLSRRRLWYVEVLRRFIPTADCELLRPRAPWIGGWL